MNIAEKLSREIERVSALRQRYRELETHLTVTAIMTAAIETGHNAAGSGDAYTIIRAIRTLEGFEA